MMDRRVVSTALSEVFGSVEYESAKMMTIFLDGSSGNAIIMVVFRASEELEAPFPERYCHSPRRSISLF